MPRKTLSSSTQFCDRLAHLIEECGLLDTFLRRQNLELSYKPKTSERHQTCVVVTRDCLNVLQERKRHDFAGLTRQMKTQRKFVFRVDSNEEVGD